LASWRLRLEWTVLPLLLLLHSRCGSSCRRRLKLSLRHLPSTQRSLTLHQCYLVGLHILHSTGWQPNITSLHLHLTPLLLLCKLMLLCHSSLCLLVHSSLLPLSGLLHLLSLPLSFHLEEVESRQAGVVRLIVAFMRVQVHLSNSRR